MAISYICTHAFYKLFIKFQLLNRHPGYIRKNKTGAFLSRSSQFIQGEKSQTSGCNTVCQCCEQVGSGTGPHQGSAAAVGRGQRQLSLACVQFGSLSFVIYMMEMIMATMSSDNAQLLNAMLGRCLGHCKCYSILVLYYYLVGVQRVNT